jgi:hypothetical protein
VTTRSVVRMCLRLYALSGRGLDFTITTNGTGVKEVTTIREAVANGGWKISKSLTQLDYLMPFALL